MTLSNLEVGVFVLAAQFALIRTVLLENNQ